MRRWRGIQKTQMMAFLLWTRSIPPRCQMRRSRGCSQSCSWSRSLSRSRMGKSPQGERGAQRATTNTDACLVWNRFCGDGKEPLNSCNCLSSHRTAVSCFLLCLTDDTEDSMIESLMYVFVRSLSDKEPIR